MFIYLFGKNDYDNDYKGYGCIEDCVEIATTDIQKILDCLSLDKMSYSTMEDYSIIVKLDGEEYYEELPISKTMHKRLIEYPPDKLLEYESEYNDMLKKVTKWCKNISVQVEEERKHNEEIERLKKEYKERAMYETLKRKYGNA